MPRSLSIVWTADTLGAEPGAPAAFEPDGAESDMLKAAKLPLMGAVRGTQDGFARPGRHPCPDFRNLKFRSF